MSMLRKDVKDFISYKLESYGRGFGYDIWLNDQYMRSTTHLKRVAQEGDNVRIDVYRGHGKYTRGYIYDQVEFEIVNDRAAIELIREIRERNRKWKADWKRPRDFQKQKLYSWERQAVEGFRDEKLDWDSVVKFVQDVFEELGIEAPGMKFHNGRTSTCSYFAGYHQIRMGAWGLTKPILIHESAHAVINKAGFNNKVASHGPAFVRVYIDLLARFLDKNADELAKSAKDAGLKVLDEFDVDYWVSRKKEGDEPRSHEIESVRLKDKKDNITLTEAQKRTLTNIGMGSKDIDGRSGRALENRGLAFSTPDGYYKITTKGEKFLKKILS